MTYASNFTLDLLGDDIPVVEMIKKVGKADDLVGYIARNIGKNVPTIGEIKTFIELRSSEILHEIGLTEDGKPLDTKKYQVFLRLVSTCKQEIEAKNPEEARELARDWVWTDPDFICLDVYRDDIETVCPVAYEEPGSMVARDFAPSEEEREALRRALVGNALWVLVHLWKDAFGNVCTDRVELFVDDSVARKRMEEEFQQAYHGAHAGGIKYSQNPTTERNWCYIADNDGSEVQWCLSKALFGSDVGREPSRQGESSRRGEPSHRGEPRWLEDRLAEAVNIFSQMQDGEPVTTVTCARGEGDPGKDVSQLMDEIRSVYPEM